MTCPQSEPFCEKTSPKKCILDATAGYRMMHINKKNPHVLFIDQRKECNPDEIQDFRNLPYPDSTFKLIIFDPPHRSDQQANWIIRDYGALIPETWQSDLKKGFKELWRILQDYGVLTFKWNDHQYPLEQLTPLFPEKPIIKQTTTNGTSSDTFWVLFMKIPKENPK